MPCCMQSRSPGHQTPLPGSSRSAVNQVAKEEKVSDGTRWALSYSVSPNGKGQRVVVPRASAQTSSDLSLRSAGF